jgi:hypothetical protein
MPQRWQNYAKDLLMLQVNEIKKWAKKYGISIKKSENGLYVWFEEKENTSEPASLNEVVTSIFNKITSNKFVEHQKNYKRQQNFFT